MAGLSFETVERVLADTYGVHMRREWANEIINPGPLRRMIGLTHDQETIDEAWATIAELATSHPPVTRDPFFGIDWNMLIAPEWTEAWNRIRLLQARRERADAVLAGEYDDDLDA